MSCRPQGLKAPHVPGWSEQEQHGWDTDLVAESPQQQCQHQPGVGKGVSSLNRRDLQPNRFKSRVLPAKMGLESSEPGGAEPLGLKRHTRHGHRSACQWQ